MSPPKPSKNSASNPAKGIKNYILIKKWISIHSPFYHNISPIFEKRYSYFMYISCRIFKNMSISVRSPNRMRRGRTYHDDSPALYNFNYIGVTAILRSRSSVRSRRRNSLAVIALFLTVIFLCTAPDRYVDKSIPPPLTNEILFPLIMPCSAFCQVQIPRSPIHDFVRVNVEVVDVSKTNCRSSSNNAALTHDNGVIINCNVFERFGALTSIAA